MKKTYISILGIVLFSLIFASCNRWEEPEFEVPVYTGPPANHTIQDIKDKHTSLGSGMQDSICSWDEPFIVKAVVVSSDQGGNCYKYMTIQDETGGIEISIDRTGLYNEYPVGQTIYLDCRGLIVGDYHNKYQIGWKDRTSVQRINQEALDRYIHKDGLPDPNNPIIAKPIEITGSSQLTTENTNCLVRINGCRFDSKYIGQPLATNDLTMDREVYINGAMVIVRTSNYANFRSTIIENKEYCLYGILSVYNDEYQLTLRTKEDIQDAFNTSDILIQSFTFDNNSLTTGGWSTNPDNNAWVFQSYQGDDFMFHNSATSNCDDWLISPEITIADLSGKILKINHHNNVEGSPATYYQVYYSTTYNGGEFNESDWTAFNPNLNSYPSNFELSNALDLSVINSSNFRIAFRYRKNGNANGTRWFIKGANIYQKTR
jgi:hypothetical protein